MKRFRLGSLMLIVVIAALAMALAVQQRRASRREAALQAEIASLRATNTQLQKTLRISDSRVQVAEAKEALARAEYFNLLGTAKLPEAAKEAK